MNGFPGVKARCFTLTQPSRTKKDLFLAAVYVRSVSFYWLSEGERGLTLNRFKLVTWTFSSSVIHPLYPWMIVKTYSLALCTAQWCQFLLAQLWSHPFCADDPQGLLGILSKLPPLPCCKQSSCCRHVDQYLPLHGRSEGNPETRREKWE